MPAMGPSEASQFMTELLAIWTETDLQSRRAAIAAHYLEDIVFHDPEGTFTGYDELEAFSDSLQQRFPAQSFEMIGEPSAVGNALRTYWRFGPVSGMDFALLSDNKVKTLYAFVEPPAAVSTDPA